MAAYENKALLLCDAYICMILDDFWIVFPKWQFLNKEGNRNMP